MTLTSKDIFDLGNTGMSEYNDMLNADIRFKEYLFVEKLTVFRMAWISPHTYFEECAKMRTGDVLKEYNMVEKELVQEYKNKVFQGSKMPLPMLDYRTDIQEGRHRAKVAMGLGISRMPVLIVIHADEEMPERFPGF